ncbi:MAG: NDMA-dependent alcohol dehydrogenase [Acidimicrobiia bacterium]|nr:NDMA-dependent alcohol dehydrogenase [Acidimicrobiia bacterium]
MKTRGAVIRSTPGEWEIVDLELDEPRQGELLLEMAASGLCHSDDHVAKGDSGVEMFPFAGGHEGSGVVAAVGPNTPGWEVGDHVVLSFLPGCGRCRWCASGMQNLCDLGATLLTGSRQDGSFRVHLADGTPVGQMCGISTFSRHTVVDVASAVKVAHDLPLDKACLVGCGVGTGWGSAVNSAEVKPGHTVIVMGIGGIGINAIQGASHAGATHVIAVDPVEMKRETAQKLGATHAFADIGAAADFARSVTNGQGADSAIVTTGVLQSDHVRDAFAAIRKAGTVVVTGIGNVDTEVNVNARELTLFQKRIQGAIFGASSPSRDILWMLDLYQAGTLKLDELVTRTYSLDEINQGYADMHAGINMRGVIVYS